MKKSILSIVFFICLSLAMDAQLSIRPQVGVNAPSLSDNLMVGNWNTSVGYQFGADVQIGTDFFIQPGLNFQTLALGIENVGDIDVSRVNLPVFIGFRLLSEEERVYSIRIFGGPNFAINVNESLSDAFNDITTENIKNSEISGIAGVGLDFSILFLDVSYKFGLSSFIENINEDVSTNLFLVNAGIRLGF